MTQLPSIITLIVLCTYVLPVVSTAILFAIAFRNYAAIYRRLKNPNFPLPVGSEAGEFFDRDPVNYVKKMPVMPFLQSRMLFEHHDHPDLAEAAAKARRRFRMFLAVLFGNFLLHAAIGFLYFLIVVLPHSSGAWTFGYDTHRGVIPLRMHTDPV
jgi:hypothetical protein